MRNGAGNDSGDTGISAHSRVSLRLELHWQSDATEHCDVLCVPEVSLAHACLPHALGQGLMGCSIGERVELAFEPGHVRPKWAEARLLRLDPSRFNRRFMGRGPFEPRMGRFYPLAMLSGFQAQPNQARGPFRVAGISAQQLVADLNHPLAEKRLQLAAEVEGVWKSEGQTRGPDVVSLLCDTGPGMQARWGGQPTDFLDGAAQPRLDDADDARFYQAPRFVDHLDRTALAEISALYGRLLPRRARILDLMSSWHSHLPPSLTPTAVTGLGMNAEELARNPVLTERVVHDLNADATLPFEAASFDAVVCTASVEYLTRPFRVFRELARVLTPGGVAVMAVSNRCFPTKSIRIWEQLHEFERLGLMLEYFRESRCFRDCRTWSLRGRPRPADDDYAHRLPASDPVYAAWAFRDGEQRLRL